MKFIKTNLRDAYLIDLEKREDERGFFARFFCKKEFNSNNLDNEIVQINNSFSVNRGTFRGLHFQKSPMSEDKIIRCVSGSLLDVIVDIRPESNTYLQHFKVELSASNRLALFVPKGFAHGFLTLMDNTEAFYLTTQFYSPEFESGLRYDDPKLNIELPFDPICITEKDRNWLML
jgi:dTDP-4-dehydrorhamnose 3,5-epimerase